MISLANLNKRVEKQEVKKVSKVSKYNSSKKTRTGEPGIKVPTSSYEQFAAMCECEDNIHTHFINRKCTSKMCDQCGLVTELKKRKKLQDVIKIIKVPVEIKIPVERMLLGM